MSVQEKKAIMYIISSILIFAGYGVYIASVAEAGDLETTNWGRSILLLVPIHVGVNVVMEVLFNIVNYIVTKEEISDVVDEMDQSIELRSTRNAFYVFSIGFLLSMAIVALEEPMYLMFNTLIYSFFAAELMWSGTQLYFYRRGL